MSPKTFIILSILTIAALGAAILAPGRNQGYQPAAGAGERMFPKLLERANDVAAVVIEHTGGQITLIKNDLGWTMQERGGYTARQVRVQRTILGMAQMTLREPKTRLKEKFAKLELQDITAEGAKSKSIKLFDDGGAVVAELIVGKRRATLAGTTTGGVYIRKPGTDQTWLAASTTDVSDDRNNWLERKITNIDAKQIKTIIIRHPDGEAISISKPSATVKNFNLDDIPPGKKLISQADLDSTAGALSGFQLDDVRKLDAPFDAATTVAADFTTFDGLSINARITMLDDAFWLTLDASGTGAAMQKAAAISARTKGWVYQISNYAAAVFLKRAKDLLEDAKTGS